MSSWGKMHLNSGTKSLSIPALKHLIAPGWCLLYSNIYFSGTIWLVQAYIKSFLLLYSLLLYLPPVIQAVLDTGLVFFWKSTWPTSKIVQHNSHKPSIGHIHAWNLFRWTIWQYLLFKISNYAHLASLYRKLSNWWLSFPSGRWHFMRGEAMSRECTFIKGFFAFKPKEHHHWL